MIVNHVPQESLARRDEVYIRQGVLEFLLDRPYIPGKYYGSTMLYNLEEYCIRADGLIWKPIRNNQGEYQRVGRFEYYKDRPLSRICQLEAT